MDAPSDVKGFNNLPGRKVFSVRTDNDDIRSVEEGEIQSVDLNISNTNLYLNSSTYEKNMLEVDEVEVNMNLPKTNA